MRFEWDAEKNLINIRKHGFDFRQAEQMFAGPAPLVVDADVREGYAEERWVGFGMIHEIVAVVAFTLVADNTIRIISLRKAKRNEQNYYYRQTF